MESESYADIVQDLKRSDWKHVVVDYGTTAMVDKAAWIYFYRAQGEDMAEIFVKARWADLETPQGREAARREAEGYWTTMLNAPHDLAAAMIEHKEKHQSAR